MFKALLWLTLICIVIAFVAEYWMWILLATAVLVVLYVLAVKRGWHKIPSIKDNKKPKALEARTLTEETFHAVGVSYYEANIRKLAYSNPDWKLSTAQIVKAGKTRKRIFKHNYVNRPVKLVPEPENPEDKNAIAVVFAGELVGYISREQNLHVKDILESREVISLSGFIGGGEYKLVNEDGDLIKAENGFSVNVRIKYI